MRGRIWLNTKSETLKKQVCKFLLKWYNIMSIFSCKVQQNGGVRHVFSFGMHCKFEWARQVFIVWSDSEKAVWLEQTVVPPACCEFDPAWRQRWAALVQQSLDYLCGRISRAGLRAHPDISELSPGFSLQLTVEFGLVYGIEYKTNFSYVRSNNVGL